MSHPSPSTLPLPLGYVRTERVGRALARVLLAAGWMAASLSAYLLISGRGGRGIEGWMVHAGCFAWDARTMGVWVVGNVGTALCYAVIPVLLYFARRLQSLPVWVIASFETFILFCGSGHLLKVWTLWHSDYIAGGVLDLATFLVSVPAAIGLGLTIWHARLSRGRVALAEGRATSAERSRDLMLERLQASNADLERFAYAASHDLQEPLRAITSYAELVREDYAASLPEEGQRWLGNVEANAHRAQTMVRDLLEFSRLSSPDSIHEPTSVRAALGQALDRLEVAIAESGSEVTVTTPLPTLRGDPAQLALLFQNLVGNAIKYRGDGPAQVEVRAEQAGGEWVIDVLDRGVGIEPASRAKVFEVFGRLHSHAEVPGTGLGLAMCKRVVERHSGRIAVVDSPDGRTCVRIHLPDEGTEPAR